MTCSSVRSHMGDRPSQLDRILVNVIGGTDLGIAQVKRSCCASKRFASREILSSVR